MYVFPGIGLGSILCKAIHITNEMVCILNSFLSKISLLINIKIYAAAIAINAAINQDELEKGMLYPDITRIREVSVTVARQVIRQAQKQKLDGEKSIRSLTDSQMDAWIKERMYDPSSQNNRTEQPALSKL
jgi:malate dehydrogenase (oxaloacetate-decarboxylating)(NADP+)